MKKMVAPIIVSVLIAMVCYCEDSRAAINEPQIQSAARETDHLASDELKMVRLKKRGKKPTIKIRKNAVALPKTDGAPSSPAVSTA